VPTMGFFHDGHLSLMGRARADNDVLVVSLFVNPAQFAPGEDFSAYPRDEERDSELAEAEGVDILFSPPVEEVYPDGFDTTVAVAALTDTLEGDEAQRGVDHFLGVTTVVTKLFNMVGPDVAYFGQKDAQQALVIRKLVRDLDIPVRIEVGETIREPDGLALSSRNARLRGDERERALALRRALDAARAAVRAGERDAAAVVAAGRAAMSGHGVEPEYVALVAPDTFVPVARLNGEQVLVAVAARVGDVRLIDNDILDGGS
jgi:pantoate--beta-alanine ligase